MAEARRTFHDSLDDLRVELVELGAAVTEAVRTAGRALRDGDRALAETVVEGDQAIDARRSAVESRCVVLIARQQPTASDLRVLLATMRVAQELERSGDLMVNVARATQRLHPNAMPTAMGDIVDAMAGQGATQLVVAIEAFADRDHRRARALVDMDDTMDELQRSLLRTIFGSVPGDDAVLHRAVEMTLVARYFERVGDHAVNIGAQVEFLVTGELPFPDVSDPGEGEER